MLFSHLMNNVGLGRWSARRRVLLVLVFGVINLLAVLLLWYWLLVFLPKTNGATWGEASARLSSIELLNQDLNTKRLALRQQTFSADLFEHVGSRKPELSYLLDLLRVMAQSNQMRLHLIRPGLIDKHGLLSIEIRAQVTLAGLTGFWAALRQAIYDAQIQQLEMLERDEPGEYELALRVAVGTGAFPDAFYAMQTDALSEVMSSSVAKPSAPKQPRGFIVRDDGSRVIYLSSDSEGRLHRVSAR
jgi:hypothetical protein